MEDFTEELKAHAQKNGYVLSINAPRVIAKVYDNDKRCPCKKDKPVCPCPDHPQEIEDKGRCTCNLFQKRV